jgi:proteic killer suppression protein
MGNKTHDPTVVKKKLSCLVFILTDVTLLVTVRPMIKSFIHRGLEDFFYDGSRKGIQAQHTSKLEAILDRLDAADEIRDMNYPGSGLHPLLPKAKGRWAIKVSGNWRLTFEFKDGDALNVNIEDYH